MKHLPISRSLRRIALTAALVVLAPCAQAAEAVRLAILGDSITYENGWPTLLESALRRTPAFADAEIVNMGIQSETVSGLSEPGHANGAYPRPDLAERLDRIITKFKPTRIIACYGMNDGIYLPLDAARFEAFKNGVKKLKQAADAQHAPLTIITPPLYFVDRVGKDTTNYDQVLDKYSEWLVSQEKQIGTVIDIRPYLRQQITIAKNQNPSYVYAPDGVHPGMLGHHMIAEVVADQFWKKNHLAGAPVFSSGEAFSILRQRSTMLRDAWLTETKHKRPGLPGGKPLPEAEKLAQELLQKYRAALKPAVTEATWQGEKRINFTVADRPALLIVPRTPRPNQPWIWRTEFFDSFPAADIALAKDGYHVAYIDMQSMYGAPSAMRVMDAFYETVTTQFGLSKKPVLEGFSRGGLYALNWAALRPTCTSGLYVDAPVCDFTSWPAGKTGASPGSPDDWKRLKIIYNFASDEEALKSKLSPIDHLAPLAQAKLPILAVVGQTDKTVPVADNINVLEKRYQALGGKIHVIRKENCDHHPHSLDNPKPIVDFVHNIAR